MGNPLGVLYTKLDKHNRTNLAKKDSKEKKAKVYTSMGAEPHSTVKGTNGLKA